ncbi:MAG: ATP-binding protein, partial [Kovacikia sp.]
MHNLEQWQTENQRHLAVSLSWLRLRLAWHILQGYIARGKPAPEPFNRVNKEKVAQAAAAVAEAEAIDPPPALRLLEQQFGLSGFEREIVLLCAAMELDKHAANLCAQLYPYQPYPTVALALSLFEAPAWDALSSERPLRYWQLIEINQPGAQPLVTSALRADERIVNYLKGLNPLDDLLMPFLIPFEATLAQVELPPSQRATVATITRYLEQKSPNASLPAIQLLGNDRLSKQLIAWFAARELGLHLYCLPEELLPTQASELETLTRLWQRESLLLPLALYLDAQEIDPAPAAEGQASPLQRFLLRHRGLCFLATREVRPNLGRSRFVVEVTKPTLAEQKTAWAEALGPSPKDTPDYLVGQFNFNLPEIQELAETALNESAEDSPDLHTRLWYHCQVNTRPRLDTLAQRLNAKATWEDIVLPDKEMTLLHQMTGQVRYRTQVYEGWGFNRKMNRGLGISALFAGDSGTGKTMAAEVIANDLQLDLYRIDLSAVVSKYIGETEKNLRRL